MGNCHLEKTNVNLIFDSVDIGFLKVTISNVTLSCSQYLYNALIIFNHEKVEYICNGLCTLKLGACHDFFALFSLVYIGCIQPYN